MPVFNNRQNKRYETTCGRELWHSRNVAVCVTIIRPNPENQSALQVLVGKRGKAVTDSGLWCMPCGYLDWDEDVFDAARREVFEEVNLEIERESLEMMEVDSNPEKARQNVTVHFLAYLTEVVDQDFTPKDFKEVEEIRWIDLEDADNFDWAFDHKARVNNLIKN